MSDESEISRTLREDDLIGPVATDAKYRDLSNQSKSLVLAERVRELVRFSDSGDRARITAPPTAEAVSTLANEIVHMWPRGLDTANIFQSVAKGHNSLYWGRRYPSGVRRTMSRASLYADRIYVINPFVDGFIFHPQRSPLVVPKDWIAIYAGAAAFVNALYPWIKAGLVEFVPNPAMVDFRLGKALATRARDEASADKEAHALFRQKHFITMSAESFLYMSDADRERVLAHAGDVTAAECSAIGEAVAKLRAMDPDISQIMCDAQSKVVRTGTGASLPAARLMAESLRASLITDDAMSIDQLRGAAEKARSPTQLLSDAFGALDFSFLNDVSVTTAMDVRQMRGVAQFRRYLQDIAGLSTLSTTSLSYDEAVQTCTERLAGEYEAYRKEWKGLEGKLAKDAFVRTPLASSMSAIVTGQIMPVLMMSTCLTGLVKSLFDFWTKRSSLASKPLGVLLKVEEA